jgi:hypothetical protein
MIKPTAIAAMLLAGTALPALAQGGPTQGTSVVGQTGTMYDGNNAQLQLAPEPNAWYEDRWAGYQLQPQSTWYFGVGDLLYAGRWIGYEPKSQAGAAAGGD